MAPINLPDGTEVSEVILPDGATASEVIAPDGSTVFGAIPDKENLQSRYNASSYDLTDGDTITTDWTDSEGSFDAVTNGDPTFRSSDINGQPAVELDGSDDYFDTTFEQDTNNPRSLYIVFNLTDTADFERIYGASDGGSTSDDIGKQDNDDYLASYGDSFFTGPSTFTEGVYVLFSVIAGSGTLTLYEDGSQINSTSFSGNGLVGYTSYIGARNAQGTADFHAPVKVADILRYNVEHTDSTRGQVESYLNDVYNLY